MRAVVMTAVGGPEVLQLADLPDPEISGGHDVLVRLRAAGINPVDYKLRSQGTIGGSLPAVLGWDGAGVVQAVGPDVTRVRPGDEVFFCDGGFHCQVVWPPRSARCRGGVPAVCWSTIGRIGRRERRTG